MLLSLLEAPVAQLDRVSDYESEGREFEPLRAHQVFNRLDRAAKIISTTGTTQNQTDIPPHVRNKQSSVNHSPHWSG